MKTIQEIASEIGVTKQAVYYRINRPPLSKALQSLLSKENGVLTVSFDGEKLIKQAFSNNERQTKVSKENTSFDSQIITILHEQLKAKDSQINEQQQTIKELTAMLKIHIAKTKTKPQKRKFKNALPEIKNKGVKKLMKSSK